MNKDNLIEGLDKTFYSPSPDDVPAIYTRDDFHRIGIIKLGADVVYSYFSDLLDDHRILSDNQKHTKRIESMIRDIMEVFALTEDDQEVAKYFAANVLKAAQTFESVTLQEKSWLPFTDQILSSLYVREDVKDYFAGMSPREYCGYAGVFLSEKSQSHAKAELVKEGMLVGADLLFVQTLKYEDLINSASQKIQEDAEDDLIGTVGELVATAPMGLFSDLDFK